MEKSDIKLLVEEVIKERWLDWLKDPEPKKSTVLSFKDWREENIAENNQYIGEDLTFFGFPLKPGEFIPSGKEDIAFLSWQIAKSEDERQTRKVSSGEWKGFKDVNQNSDWLKGY